MKNALRKYKKLIAFQKCTDDVRQSISQSTNGNCARFGHSYELHKKSLKKHIKQRNRAHKVIRSTPSASAPTRSPLSMFGEEGEFDSVTQFQRASNWMNQPNPRGEFRQACDDFVQLWGCFDWVLFLCHSESQMPFRCSDSVLRMFWCFSDVV